MHPFYGPSARMLSQGESRTSGLLSMAAYLAFWAAAIALAKRELDARFPRVASRSDPAIAALRERFARGDIDADQLHAMLEVLRSQAAGRTGSPR